MWKKAPLVRISPHTITVVISVAVILWHILRVIPHFVTITLWAFSTFSTLHPLIMQTSSERRLLIIVTALPSASDWDTFIHISSLTVRKDISKTLSSRRVSHHHFPFLFGFVFLNFFSHFFWFCFTKTFHPITRWPRFFQFPPWINLIYCSRCLSWNLKPSPHSPRSLLWSPSRPLSI